MRKFKLKSNPKYLLCFIFSLIFIYSFNETTSRYLGEIQANDDIVAVPILSLNKTDVSYNIENMIPGDEREFTFAVSNTENTNINEVLLSYNLEVQLDSDIPFVIEIYDENSEQLPLYENETSEEEMPYGETITKNYKVKIIWNENDNKIEYAGQSVNLNINLKAIQIL